PVGTGRPAVGAATRTVKTTAWPSADGFGELAIATVGSASTCCVRTVMVSPPVPWLTWLRAARRVPVPLSASLGTRKFDNTQRSSSASTRGRNRWREGEAGLHRADRSGNMPCLLEKGAILEAVVPSDQPEAGRAGRTASLVGKRGILHRQFCLSLP